jgi:hypothetical protein
LSITTEPSSGVATLSGNVITIQSIGKINVKASVVGNNNYNAGNKDCPAIDIAFPTAIEDDALAAATQIFPNPSEGRFTIKVALPNLPKLAYRVLDSQGKVIKEGTVPKAGNQYEMFLDLRQQAQGVYILELTKTEGRTLSRRLVIE